MPTVKQPSVTFVCACDCEPFSYSNPVHVVSQWECRNHFVAVWERETVWWTVNDHDDDDDGLFFIRTITMNGFIGCACVSLRCMIWCSLQVGNIDISMIWWVGDDWMTMQIKMNSFQIQRLAENPIFFIVLRYATHSQKLIWKHKTKTKQFFCRIFASCTRMRSSSTTSNSNEKGRKVIGHIQKFYQLHNTATITIIWHYK